MIFSKFEKSSSTNWIFCLFRTRFLQATQVVKIWFEIDKKPSSSNLIFQTRDFKNQMEMDRGIVTFGDIFISINHHRAIGQKMKKMLL